MNWNGLIVASLLIGIPTTVLVLILNIEWTRERRRVKRDRNEA